MTSEDLKSLTHFAPYAIFGAIGMAGNNNVLNCENGLYGPLDITLEQEKLYQNH